MNDEATKIARRQFALTGLAGAAGLAIASSARGQDIETYRGLGLHQPFVWRDAINGRTREEAFSQPAEDNQYNPCAEAYPTDDTPRGKVSQIEKWNESSFFDGTQRDISIYPPAQLASSTEPPALMVFNDGWRYQSSDGEIRVPAVLDTLIHKGELPPTVAVFVNPGVRVVPRDSANPEYGHRGASVDLIARDGDYEPVGFDNIRTGKYDFVVLQLSSAVLLDPPIIKESRTVIRRVCDAVSESGAVPIVFEHFAISKADQVEQQLLVVSHLDCRGPIPALLCKADVSIYCV